MKAQITLNGLVVEVEGETQTDLFIEIASAHEVYGEKQCGLCKGTDIYPASRTVTKGKDVYQYSEWVCRSPKCFARLSLGQNRKGGGLFPIRKLTPEGQPSREKGSYGPHNGWTKYRGEPSEENN